MVWGDRFGGNADTSPFDGLPVFPGLFVGENFDRLPGLLRGLLKGDFGFGDSTLVGSSKNRSSSSSLIFLAN